MKDVPARMTILMDPNRKKEFEALCAARGLTASEVIRTLVREYVAGHTTPRRGRDAAAPRGN